jgi:hypothetical protein
MKFYKYFLLIVSSCSIAGIVFSQESGKLTAPLLSVLENEECLTDQDPEDSVEKSSYLSYLDSWLPYLKEIAPSLTLGGLGALADAYLWPNNRPSKPKKTKKPKEQRGIDETEMTQIAKEKFAAQTKSSSTVMGDVGSEATTVSAVSPVAEIGESSSGATERSEALSQLAKPASSQTDHVITAIIEVLQAYFRSPASDPLFAIDSLEQRIAKYPVQEQEAERNREYETGLKEFSINATNLLQGKIQEKLKGKVHENLSDRNRQIISESLEYIIKLVTNAFLSHQFVRNALLKHDQGAAINPAILKEKMDGIFKHDFITGSMQRPQIASSLLYAISSLAKSWTERQIDVLDNLLDPLMIYKEKKSTTESPKPLENADREVALHIALSVLKNYVDYTESNFDQIFEDLKPTIVALKEHYPEAWAKAFLENLRADLSMKNHYFRSELVKKLEEKNIALSEDVRAIINDGFIFLVNLMGRVFNARGFLERVQLEQLMQNKPVDTQALKSDIDYLKDASLAEFVVVKNKYPESLFIDELHRLLLVFEERQINNLKKIIDVSFLKDKALA